MPALRFPSLSLAALAALLAVPAVAAPTEAPADFVRSIYDGSIYNPLEDAGAARMTGKALEVMRKSEKESVEGEGVGCIDFVPTADGQDYDEETIRETLEVEGDADPITGKATIMARFFGFPESPDAEYERRPTTILYDLVPVGNDWRIDDMASLDEGSGAENWRLSTLCGE